MIEFEIPLLSDAAQQTIGASFSKSHIIELVQGKGEGGVVQAAVKGVL